MSFATDGDTEDLGPLLGRRPISVAALLEREGYRPATRSRATKRALSGVAAGAVLALGAVVGSLLLNHGASSTAGDTLASGSQSGGDIVLAETGTQYGTAHSGSTANTSTTQGTTQSTLPAGANSNSGAPKVSQNGTHGGGSASHGHTDDSVVNGRGYTGYTGGRSTTSGAAGTTAPATSDAPTTTGSAPTTPPATTTTTDTPPSNSTSGTAPSTTSPDTTSTTQPTTTSSGGGLLGTVTGTVTGTLGNVTAPVFNWFG